MASDLDRLRAKPAHRDKSLGAALAAALAIISATRDADTVVAAAGVVGASIIVAVAVAGRYLLRGNAVTAAGYAVVNEIVQPAVELLDTELPIEEIRELLGAHAAESSDKSAGVTIDGLPVDDGGEV